MLTFKGLLVNTERVDAMTDTEVEEVYARYEAHFGAMMTISRCIIVALIR